MKLRGAGALPRFLPAALLHLLTCVVLQSGSDPPAAAGSASPQGRDACRQGQEESRQGRRQAALAAFRRGLELDPAQPDCRAALATLLLREFRWREAEAEFRRVVADTQDPGRRELLLVGLGEALERQGEREQAIRSYEAALSLDVSSLRALGHLAVARRGAGDLDGSAAVWRAYLEKNPRDAAAVERLEEVLRLQAELRVLEAGVLRPEAGAAAWDALARARTSARDAEGALVARRAAAGRAPRDAERLLLVGLGEIETGRGAAGVKTLERVLELDPDLGVAYAWLAHRAERSGDAKGERGAWERWLKRHPLELVALRRRVDLARLAGGLEREEERARRRALADPEGGGAALLLAMIRSAKGDEPGALQAFALALERAPCDPAIQVALRDHLRSAGGREPARRKGQGRAPGKEPHRPGPAPSSVGQALLDAHLQAHLRAAPDPPAAGLEALAALAALAARHPRRADLRTALGDFHSSAGELEEARREYRRALDIDPAEPFALLGLALMALREGDPAAAEAPARQVVERQPRHRYALATLAAALYRQGKHVEAAAAARAALAVDPFEQAAGSRFLLGRALASLGELRAAEEVVRGDLPRAGWLLYDQAWGFARDLFLGMRPPAFWEAWRRRPGALAGEEEALMKIAGLLAALEETYTRLRTPEETLERYFSRRPDSAHMTAGSTPEANRSVIARRLGENLAYLRLADFQSPDIAAVVRQILEEFRDAPGLVLDLRGNPGGLRDEARKVAELLVEPDTLLEFERTLSGDAVVKAGPQAGAFPDQPVVVLVDEGTGSAAESLARILQSSGRATVVGDRTRGKDVAQAVSLLPGGYSLLVTAGQTLDAGGEPVGSGGVEGQPPAARPESADPALDEARELLSPPH